MKRSAALKLMQEAVEYQGSGLCLREKDCNVILEALEGAGMLPPETNFYEKETKGPIAGVTVSKTARIWDDAPSLLDKILDHWRCS